MASRNSVTLTDADLEKYLERATREVEEFVHRVAPAAGPPGPSAQLGGRRIAVRPMQSFEPPKPPESAFRLADRIRAIRPRDALLSDTENRVLRAIRRAIQIYFAIYDSYDDASGLRHLKDDNRAGKLAPGAEPELTLRIETGSVASAFALNSFVLSTLPGDADEDSLDLAPPEWRDLASKTATLREALYHIHCAIDAHARDDASLVRAVHAAAREQAVELQRRSERLQHVEAFTRYAFRVEPDDVEIVGFELPELRVRNEISVPTRRPEEVVGNHIAKLEASRIAQRLACYDPEHQQNPFVDLGGFVFSFIGDGSPGTGKTTLIQMVVSLLSEYCEVAQLPLRYHNFSIDEISDYQGRSGQNAKRFFQRILDPRGVGFGTVDDVDQVCGNRNDRNASAGQLEVTGVFMQELGGANTVVRGNATFGLFSNFPEKVDDALRQRTQTRFAVDGPRTEEDYTDLLHILLADDWKIPLGAGYEPLATQQVRRMIEEKYHEHGRPRSEALFEVFEQRVAERGAEAFSTWRDFGEYLHAIGQRDPRFTGRAVKNIADAVQSRMMDFDLPAEWLENRSVFFDRPYSERVEMVRALRGEITPEIVLQEINRYADSEQRYSESARDREFEQRVEDILLEMRAREHAAQRRS